MLFCHSGLDPESSFFQALRFWMPDQVRHDRQKPISSFELRHRLQSVVARFSPQADDIFTVSSGNRETSFLSC
jgi:hypothetical protein